MDQNSHFSNQHDEIEDILNELFVTADLAASRVQQLQDSFQEYFLTLENKKEFLDYLKDYFVFVAKKPGCVQKRLKQFQMEVDFFLDKFAGQMSFFNVVGIEDPNKLNQSLNGSHDSKDWSDILKFRGVDKEGFNLTEA